DDDNPIRYRIRRVDTPETHGPTKAAGLVAAEYTRNWITEHLTHGDGTSLIAETHKYPGKSLTDSFGRYLAEIYCAAGHNLSDDLLSSGNAVPFPPRRRPQHDLR